MKKYIIIILLVLFYSCANSQILRYPFVKTSVCTSLGINSLPDAMYSFRLLTSCYAGQCIRLRRSSDNVESDFGFTSGFVDTTAIKTFISTSNAFVVRWYDQSTHGDTLSQSTTTAQPKLATTGALIYANGRLAIQFDGTDDILGCTVPDIIGDKSYFAISKRAGAGNFDALTIGIKAAQTYSGLINFNTTNQLRVDYNSNIFSSAMVGTSNTNLNICVGIISGTSILASNGTTTSTATIAGNIIGSGLVRLAVGAIDRNVNVYSAGYSCEAVYFSSSQIVNRTAIEANMKTYYGL